MLGQCHLNGQRLAEIEACLWPCPAELHAWLAALDRAEPASVRTSNFQRYNPHTALAEQDRHVPPFLRLQLVALSRTPGVILFLFSSSIRVLPLLSKTDHAHLSPFAKGMAVFAVQ